MLLTFSWTARWQSELRGGGRRGREGDGREWVGCEDLGHGNRAKHWGLVAGGPSQRNIERRRATLKVPVPIRPHHKQPPPAELLKKVQVAGEGCAELTCFSLAKPGSPLSFAGATPCAFGAAPPFSATGTACCPPRFQLILRPFAGHQQQLIVVAVLGGRLPRRATLLHLPTYFRQ